MTGITAPGVYDGVPEADYHADPALSASGAKKLLPPSCPAKYAWERDHPRPPTDAMELGTAAHWMVLGAGTQPELVDADNYYTKAAKEARDEIRERGGVPLLRHQYDQVQAMAEALRGHPFASLLLGGLAGKAEQSAWWQDDRTGIWCRCRYDYLIDPRGGQLYVPDYKSAQSADPVRFGRHAYDLCYHIQAWWYLDGARALNLGEDPAYLLIAQDKEPPYLVSVTQPDADFLAIGEQQARKARDLYARCAESGHWPGYGDDVQWISPPPWATVPSATTTWEFE